MRKLFLLSALLFGAGVSSCTTYTDAGVRTVDREYSRKAIRWQSGDFQYLAYRAYEERGKTLLCGADVRVGSGVDRRFMDLALEKGRILSGDTLLARNLSFFRSHDKDVSINGQAARCVLIDLDWSPAFAGDLDYESPRNFYVEE